MNNMSKNVCYKWVKMKNFKTFVTIGSIIWFLQMLTISPLLKRFPTAGSSTDSIYDASAEESANKIVADTIVEIISSDFNKTENSTSDAGSVHVDGERSIAVDAVVEASGEDRLISINAETNISVRHATIDDENKTESAVASTIESVPIELNLTVEENQIPVFSEWAQKKLEEVEKEVEQDVVNSSSQRKNASASNKAPVTKLRGAKNYASPDCGAKIVAANAESSSTGKVLTSTKDEYLLSPCKSRIWFVVELCEAIQAEHIDLANFELFSSSPKNFSVGVSSRFPTREWTNVGRFIAKDERYVQNFDLHPHLFGKYVRVDIHSHYNSEHFCPISLFRVYGTSEFEAFETENRQHPIDDLDDGDGDDEEVTTEKAKSNLFKSASDAVMSIVDTVKKAAAYVKPQGNKTNVIDVDASAQQNANNCWTPNFMSMCEKCPQSLTNEMNALLQCKHDFLNKLLRITLVRNSIRKSQFCANVVGIDMELINCDGPATSTSITPNPTVDRQLSNLQAEYVSRMLPIKYLAAMCNLLAAIDKKLPWNNATNVATTPSPDDAATNVTIDKKASKRHSLKRGQVIPTTETLLEESEKIPIALDGAIREDDKSAGSGATPTPTTIVVDASSTVVTESKTEREIVTAPPQETISESSTETNTEPQQSSSTTATASSDENIEVVDNTEQQNIFNIIQPQPTVVDTTISQEIMAGEIVPPTIETKPNTNGNWDVMEDPIDVTPPTKVIDLNGGSDDASAPPQLGQKLHSESVFLRLSNRVKALERNMSLSGQYLEELSRRYKRQVEELQQSFAKTIVNIEEQGRRNMERKQELFDQNLKLRADLDLLTDRLFSWRSIITIGACFFGFQIILFYLMLRLYTRTPSPTSSSSSTTAVKPPSVIDAQQSNANGNNRRRKSGNTLIKVRRKSAEEKKNASNAVAALQRRPSSEALHITGTYEELLIKDSDSTDEITIHMKGNGHDHASATAITTNNDSRNRMRCQHSHCMDAHGDDFIRIEDLKELYDKPALSDDYAVYGPPSQLQLDRELNGIEDICDSESINDSSLEPSPNKNKRMSKATKNGSKNGERRVSSPSFFKAPFVRNAKERSTGWEWHRSKKQQQQQQHPQQPKSSQTIINRKAKSESPNALRMNGLNGNLPNASSILPKKTANNNKDVMRHSNESMRSSIGGVSITSNSEPNKQGSFRRLLKKMF